MQRKKHEKERLQRVLTDLEENYASVEVLNKFHSSKNLNISFDKVVQKQQEKNNRTPATAPIRRKRSASEEESVGFEI